MAVLVMGNARESLQDAPRLSCFGELREQAKRRRDAQRGIIRLLDDALFRRTEDTEKSSTWASPLGWRVTISVSAVGWQVDILDPRGDLYRRLHSPIDIDVDRELP